ncbi:hypothetical protein K1T71_007890 [Dendrolimus kikuchii]|uniref:Uncharacterized protein n=1 Tax=Dendrolimus kikuchii TaxID=765133 RepID=A0ACC1CYP4_9NEOP|nr:hypothetical protein K1T71_007890 [Dendrolimus kikuchii]
MFAAFGYLYYEGRKSKNKVFTAHPQQILLLIKISREFRHDIVRDCGYVAAEIGEMTVIGCYFSPNRRLVDFEGWLDEVGAVSIVDLTFASPALAHRVRDWRVLESPKLDYTECSN